MAASTISRRCALVGLAAAYALPVAAAPVRGTVLLQLVDPNGPSAEFEAQHAAGASLAFGKSLPRVTSLPLTIKVAAGGGLEAAVAQAQKSNQDPCLFGGSGAAVVAALAPKLSAAGVPVVGPINYSDEQRDALTGLIFGIRARLGREFRAVASHLELVGQKQFALLHLANAEGEQARAQFEAIAKQAGLILIKAAGVATDGSNLVGIVDQLLSVGVKVLLLHLPGSMPTTAYETAQAAGAAVHCYATSLTVDEGSPNLVISRVVPSPADLRSEVAQEYRKLCQGAGIQASYAGYEGFLTARLLKVAMEQAGARQITLLQALRQQRVRLASLNIDGSMDDPKHVELVLTRAQGGYLR